MYRTLAIMMVMKQFKYTYRKNGYIFCNAAFIERKLPDLFEKRKEENCPSLLKPSVFARINEDNIRVIQANRFQLAFNRKQTKFFFSKQY